MISARAMCLEASAANCIISTAPMAKFGQKTLAPLTAPRARPRRSPLVPITT